MSYSPPPLQPTVPHHDNQGFRDDSDRPPSYSQTQGPYPNGDSDRPPSYNQSRGPYPNVPQWTPQPVVTTSTSVPQPVRRKGNTQKRVISKTNIQKLPHTHPPNGNPFSTHCDHCSLMLLRAPFLDEGWPFRASQGFGSERLSQ